MVRDLREPTGPPDPGGFAGREREVRDLLLLLSGRRERLEPLVLHGPAGVGKSALAAEVARKLDATVHWITPGRTVDIDRILLQLLAECEAPRVPIVRAALKGSRGFSRELRDQCVNYVGAHVLVLDDVHPSDARPLLAVLRDCSRLTVILTTRQASGWTKKVRLYRVLPLENVDALVVAATFAMTDSAEPLAELTAAAHGLPYLARIAGALVKQEPREVLSEVVEEPDDLIDLVLNLCTPDEYQVLELLAQRESPAPFTVLTVQAVLQLLTAPPDAGEMVDRLVKWQLVQPWNEEEGEFLLPAPVADAVRDRAHLVSPVSRQLAEDAGCTLLYSASLLDGRDQAQLPDGPLAPPELARYVDEFIDLVANDERQWQGREPIAALATLLAVLGDAHRLVWLHRRWQSLIPSVSRALATLALGLGMPEHARKLLDGDDSAHAVHERAAIEHESGRLGAALDLLDGRLPERDDVHAAWHALVHGAVLCDQGDAHGAEVVLRAAVELHRRFGCRRGEGWALLHLARTYLLRGSAREAEGLLGQAEETLRSVGDQRGQNWVATERIRLPGSLRADPGARKTLAAHAKADDPRGMGWTELYLALVTAAAGTMGPTPAMLGRADVHFVRCQDALGSAWTRHRLALLGSLDPRDEQEQWELVHEQFLETGCTIGTAWTGLELAARHTAPEAVQLLLNTAESEFRALSNVRGVAWVAAVRAVQSNPPTHPDRTTLITLLPPHLPDRDQLLLDIEAFCDDGGPLNGRPIPFFARDTVVTVATASDFMDLPGPGGPRCRVRLTLLDESPSTGTTARLLLRVAPEQGHPWAARDVPWLTATALPLTRASVEPASALLRPSEREAHGAEFDFTPHRTGTHRIRFTIALERTGTVLQQVETELDILDNGRPGNHAAPHAVTPRGR
ncbi:tetratricopeptide repeat protein [Streptomyces sp. NBC_00287]|uniref:tetratricopeptide repeat protein n=1 Tax=Streptomyces sp. NBC_00287 TaxID=2975702 RepID=UPI002E28F28D|nr:tetratricopeptide repeat protein [Streptomyces sp. NBC_00287]